MGTQVVSMSFPAGTPANIVQQQFAQAVYRSVFQQHGIDTSKQVFSAPPAVMSVLSPAVVGSTPIAQAAFAAAAGGPITVSAIVDGGTGAITASQTLSKSHITAGNEVLDPNYVPPTSPPTQKNPPTHPPKAVDPLTGVPIDAVATYGAGAAGAPTAGGSPLKRLLALGATAGLGTVGALVGNVPGLAVGLAAGAVIDLVRARAKKPVIGA